MQIVFLGTPQFAVPTLEALVAAGHSVSAVYTQPDRPKGRGQSLAFSPVKECALRLGLEVRQPPRIRRPECLPELAALRADAMVVVGYGQIIPQSIIDLPRLGIVNVHASLLPRWRGAAPIQWSIAAGDTVTGVTTMMIDAGLDTGDILLTAEMPIEPADTALTLSARLAPLGAGLLIKTLELLERGACPRCPQDSSPATLARILTKEDGLVDWHQPADVIAHRARGFQPWPGAYTYFRGQRLHLWSCRPAEVEAPSVEPGVLFTATKRLYATTATTPLELVEMQLEGRKRVPARDFLNGAKLVAPETLTAG